MYSRIGTYLTNTNPRQIFLYFIIDTNTIIHLISFADEAGGQSERMMRPLVHTFPSDKTLQISDALNL